MPPTHAAPWVVEVRPAFTGQFRRRRPVRISKDVLDAFQHLSMQETAEVLCISETTLKRACRQLGIRRWQRDPPRPHLGAALAAAAVARAARRAPQVQTPVVTPMPEDADAPEWDALDYVQLPSDDEGLPLWDDDLALFPIPEEDDSLMPGLPTGEYGLPPGPW